MEYIANRVTELQKVAPSQSRDNLIGRYQERFKELAEDLPGSWISEVNENGELILRSIFDVEPDQNFVPYPATDGVMIINSLGDREDDI